MALWLAVSFALAFSFTNGFHDAANAIATLVATRGARPGQAVVLSALFNMLGALLVGTAVADTIAGIVTVGGPRCGRGDRRRRVRRRRLEPADLVARLALELRLMRSSVAWSARRSCGRGRRGELGRPGRLEAGRCDRRPDRAGAVVAPRSGSCGRASDPARRRLVRRATGRCARPIRSGEWAIAAALSFSHGANDAQKAMGVIAALLLASGRVETSRVPLWAKLACGAMLTLGTVLGGWRIVRTVGRGIVRLRPMDAFASQTSSTAVILPASFIGAPVSTTQVVASSVVASGRAAALAACALDGRARDGLRLAADASGHRRAGIGYLLVWEGARMRRNAPLVPAGYPGCARHARRAGRGHGRRDEGARRLGGRRRSGGRAVRDASTGRRLASASCGRPDEAFTTPLEPEDIFELSRGLDRVLNNAKNAVREAEVIQMAPDAAIAEMAAELAEGVPPPRRRVRRARGGEARSRPRRRPGRSRARAGSSTSIGGRCRPWSRSTTCARWPRNGSSTAALPARATTCAKSPNESGIRC